MNKSMFRKVREAERILQEEKEELFEIVTREGIDSYGSSWDFLSLVEEDAKYRIRALKLPRPLLQYYLRKICDIYGPYSEDQPARRKKYYDNDLYMNHES